MTRLLSLALLLGIPACSCGEDGGTGDADADTDTDSDSDSDSDGDTDSDTGPAVSTLTVVVTGAGAGTVTSDVGGISCRKDGGVCEASVERGSEVMLTAGADEGFVFHGWSDAVCRGGLPCTVRVDADVTVRGGFVPILFRSWRMADGSDALDTFGRLWTVHTDGTGLELVPGQDLDGVYYSSGRWSPDGDRIFYAATTGTDLASHPWVMDAAGTNAIDLQPDTQDAQGYGGIWSPDGTRILFESDADPAGGDTVIAGENLWIANADGTGLMPLTTWTEPTVNHPHFSPDGTEIVFETTAALDGSDVVTTSRNLWVMASDGSGLLPLTQYTTAGISCYPRENGGYSPDGAWIVYWSDAALDGSDALNTDGAPNVWVISSDGAEMTALTSYHSEPIYPDDAGWSPDGTQILFQSSGLLDGTDEVLPGGGINLWVMGADGTGMTPLTHNTNAEHTGPRFSADGAQIMWLSNRTLDGAIGINDNETVNVWIADADGRNPTAVTTVRAEGTDSSAPDW